MDITESDPQGIRAGQTYLSELSQPWRCWSPSGEVVSETLSTKITSQHTHSHTLEHIKCSNKNHTSYFLCVNLPPSVFFLGFFELFLSVDRNSSTHAAFTSMSKLVLVRVKNCFQTDSPKGAQLQDFLNVCKWFKLTERLGFFFKEVVLVHTFASIAKTPNHTIKYNFVVFTLYLSK